MKQKIIRTVASLIAAGTKASAGAAETAATVSLHFNTKAVIDGYLNALITARDNHEQGKIVLRQRRDTLGEVKDTTHLWVATVRESLKRKFGLTFTIDWEGTGFRRSLQIPRTVDGLLDVVRSLKAFMGNHQTLEVAPLNITAAFAQTVLDDLTSAQNAVTAQKLAVDTLLVTRKEKEAALSDCLSGLVEELGLILPPLDPRWKVFGLNMPGAQETPAIPGDLVVALIGSNAVAVKWSAAARADYYRVWKKVVGVDQEFVAVGSPADLDFMIEGLPANATIEIAISAVNNGGESAKSAIATVTMP